MQTFKKEDNSFYVYIYLDVRSPGTYIYDNYHFNYKPFYVGKGKGNRKFYHLNEACNYNNHKRNIIKKIIDIDKIPEIITIAENLTEYNAFKLEKEIIKLIGRENTNTGCLTNLTDGGEGFSGLKWSEESRNKIKGSGNNFYKGVHSQETINKIKAGSKKRIGKTWEEIMGVETATKLKIKFSENRKGENNPNYINKGKTLEEISGVDRAIEIKIKQSKSHTGMKYSEETNKKKGSKGEDNYFHKNPMKGSRNGRAKILLVTTPTGKEIIVHGRMNEFCKENNISNNKFRKLIKKEIHNYNGWEVEELTKNDLIVYENRDQYEKV